MRCLNCGNPLSVLQKFSDGDFCSAEHRNSFHNEQQQLMIERLKASAARLQQHRNKQPAVKPTLAPEEAPPRPATFLLPQLVVMDCQFALTGFPVLDWDTLPRTIPTLGKVGPATAHEPKLFSDLPWPKYNPGLWFIDFEFPEQTGEHLEIVALILAAWRPIQATMPAGRLAVSRRPDVFAPQRAGLRGDDAWRWPEKTELAGCSAQSCQVRLPDFEVEAAMPHRERLFLARPRPAVSLPKPLDIQAQQLPCPGTQALKLRVPVPEAEPALMFLDKVYRMRPRAGVTDRSTVSARQTTLEPLLPKPAPCAQFLKTRGVPTPGTAAFARNSIPAIDHGRISVPIHAGASTATPPPPHYPDAGQAEIPELQPTAAARVLLGACLLPAADESIAGSIDGSNSALSLESAPADPRVLLPECAPVPVERFFRPRPRGPIASNAVAPMEAIPAEAEWCADAALRPEASDNGMEARCEPTHIGRFFRPGSLAASAHNAAVESIPAEDTPFDSPAIRPAAPANAHEPQLRSVETAFRARPRTGVTDARVDGLVGTGIVPFGFKPGPTVPDARMGECAPAQCNRFFRPRPRGPVAAQPASSESIPTAPLPSVATQEIPQTSTPVVNLAPTAAARFFRIRTRGVVPDSSLLTWIQPPASALPLDSSPAFPHAAMGICLPQLIERFFRARPRGPLAPSSSPGCEASDLSPVPYSLDPAQPSIRASAHDLLPPAVERFFRPRPRPAADARLLELTTPKLSIETTLLQPVSPATGLPECEPSLQRRFFRQRPGGAATSANLSAQEHLEAEAEPFTPSPAIPVDEPARQELTPRTETRVFRTRPRPTADARLLELTTPTLSVETVTLQPVSPATRLADCEPGLQRRFFRQRPGGPATSSNLSDHEHLEAAAEPFPPAPAIPTEEPAHQELTPRTETRVFRTRPRAGVVDASLQQTTGHADQVLFPPGRPLCLDAGLPDCEPRRMQRFFRPRSVQFASSDLQPEVIASAADAFGVAPTLGSVTAEAHDCEPRRISQTLAASLSEITARTVSFENILAVPQVFVSDPMTMRQRLGEPLPRFVARLFRARPRPLAVGAVPYLPVSTETATFAGSVGYASFGPDALGILAPGFLNRLYRLRPRPAADDAATSTRTIRCRQIPTSDPEPVRPTTPPASVLTACPAFLERMFRMRPRTGRDTDNSSRSIPAVPFSTGRSATSPTDSHRELVRSVARHWKVFPLELEPVASRR